MIQNLADSFVGHLDGKFMELVPDTAGAPEGVFFFHGQDKLFGCCGQRWPARAFMLVGLSFCQEVFPNGKDGFRGGEGEEAPGAGCLFKKGSDKIFFVRLKGDVDILFDKGLNSKGVHEKDMQEAFPLGNIEEDEFSERKEQFGY